MGASSLDYTAFAMDTLGPLKARRQVRIPEQTVAHWESLQDMSLADAVEAVNRAIQANPDVDAQSIYEPAGFWSVGVFAKYFCEEYITENFGGQHETFFSLFRRDERDRHLNILAPRGSGKSTCVARIYPLHCLFYFNTYQELGLPADTFILIVSQAYHQAMDHVIAIKDKIESDDRFVHLMGDNTWGVRMLRTSDGVQLTSLSVNANLRGLLKGTHRPTLIIKDDVDASDTVINPLQRKKALQWHNTTLLPAGVSGFTNFISIDTLKHPESLASLLRTWPRVRTTHLRAIPNPPDLRHPEHEDLWEQWERLYSDMSVDEDVREARAQRYYEQHESEMMSDVQELWPERLAYRKIREFIVDRGYRETMQEYQNDISAADEFIFDMEKASRFHVTQHGFERADKVLVRWNEMSGATVFLDWAGTKSDTKNNCFAAVTCIVWVPQRGRSEIKWGHMASTQGYLYRAWCERGTGVTQFKAMLDIFEEVRGLLLSKVTSHVPKFHCVVEGQVDTTGYATIGMRHVFESVLAERAFKEVDLKVLSRAGADEKHRRIRALQAPFDNAWLHFHENLPAEYERQLSLFPTADFDDAPDSLEGACHVKFCVPRMAVPYPYRKGSAEDKAVRRAREEKRRVRLR